MSQYNLPVRLYGYTPRHTTSNTFHFVFRFTEIVWGVLYLTPLKFWALKAIFKRRRVRRLCRKWKEYRRTDISISQAQCLLTGELLVFTTKGEGGETYCFYMFCILCKPMPHREYYGLASAQRTPMSSIFRLPILIRLPMLRRRQKQDKHDWQDYHLHANRQSRCTRYWQTRRDCGSRLQSQI